MGALNDLFTDGPIFFQCITQAAWILFGTPTIFKQFNLKPSLARTSNLPLLIAVSLTSASFFAYNVLSGYAEWSKYHKSLSPERLTMWYAIAEVLGRLTDAFLLLLFIAVIVSQWHRCQTIAAKTPGRIPKFSVPQTISFLLIVPILQVESPLLFSCRLETSALESPLSPSQVPWSCARAGNNMKWSFLILLSGPVISALFLFAKPSAIKCYALSKQYAWLFSTFVITTFLPFLIWFRVYEGSYIGFQNYANEDSRGLVFVFRGYGLMAAMMAEAGFIPWGEVNPSMAIGIPKLNDQGADFPEAEPRKI